jgi:hypothetical protein
MATQSDDTNTGVITTIVVVGSFAMISISAMVTALVRSQHMELDKERPTNADLDTVAALEQQQLARINAPPAWVAERGGKVHIPIARAMSLVVEEYRKSPDAASPPPPPGLQMNTAPATGPAGAPMAAPGPSPNPTPAGAQQPVPATPSPATPNPAAPDPTVTKRVVPPPAAPGPPAAPAPGGRP